MAWRAKKYPPPLGGDYKRRVSAEVKKTFRAMVIWFLCFGCFSCWFSMPWGLNVFFHPVWIEQNNSPPEIWHHFLPEFSAAVFV
jgi:hypothetical protein